MAKLTLARKRFFTFILVSIPIVVPVVIAEVYLRIQGDLSTYSEKVGEGYVSYYNGKREIELWTYPAHSDFFMDHKEFKYRYEVNALGIREKKGLLSQPAGKNALRIITLGDSFTEGMGAPYDSAWPRALEQKLSSLSLNDTEIQVYNAGVSGSDPILNYMMLKEKLLDFKPDLVVQSVNTSDLTDYLYRGGMERFRNGGMEFRPGPWWQIFYRLSYIVRLVLHGQFEYNFLLMDETAKEETFRHAVDVYYDLIKNQMQPLADSCGFKMVYLMQPMSDELRYDCCDYHYLSTLDSLLKEDQLYSFNFFDPMKKKIGADFDHKYDWPIDRHYNSNGYRVIGELMADTLFSLFEFGQIQFTKDNFKEVKN